MRNEESKREERLDEVESSLRIHDSFGGVDNRMRGSPDKENLVVEVRYEIHVRGETRPGRGWFMSRRDANINNKPSQEQNEAATANED